MSPIILIGLSKCTSMYIVWMEYNLKKLKLKMAEKFLENIWGAINSHSEVLDLFRKYTEGKLVSCPILVSQLEEIKEQVKGHCGIQETGTYS